MTNRLDLTMTRKLHINVGVRVISGDQHKFVISGYINISYLT